MSDAKDAGVDRLTREEIEAAHDALCAAVAMNLDMSKHWCEQKWEQAHMLRDLALQSLSQEAVRDEALEEAAKRCEAAIAELDITDDVLKIDDYFKGFKAAVEARARAIRALKREPNAAAQGGPTASHSVAGTDHAGSASPAPAAPDVASVLAQLEGTAKHMRAAYPNLKGDAYWLDQAAALLRGSCRGLR